MSKKTDSIIVAEAKDVRPNSAMPGFQDFSKISVTTKTIDFSHVDNFLGPGKALIVYDIQAESIVKLDYLVEVPEVDIPKIIVMLIPKISKIAESREYIIPIANHGWFPVCNEFYTADAYHILLINPDEDCDCDIAKLRFIIQQTDVS